MHFGVGELRSMLPPTVNVMALTATATKILRLELSNILGMINPTAVVFSPCKPNISYFVMEFRSMNETFQTLLVQLTRRTSCPRTIIYCQTFQDCSNLYLFLKVNLGVNFTEPPGAPTQLSRYRLVEMFTSFTPVNVKDQIISAFTASQVRVVCATKAFGMGVNCPDVRQVLHLGPREDLESYIQETGQVVRDGLISQAILLKRKGVLDT